MEFDKIDENGNEPAEYLEGYCVTEEKTTKFILVPSGMPEGHERLGCTTCGGFSDVNTQERINIEMQEKAQKKKQGFN